MYHIIWAVMILETKSKLSFIPPILVHGARGPQGPAWPVHRPASQGTPGRQAEKPASISGNIRDQPGWYTYLLPRGPQKPAWLRVLAKLS